MRTLISGPRLVWMKYKRFSFFVFFFSVTLTLAFFEITAIAQSNLPKTPTGFHYPVNSIISNDANWLACGYNYDVDTRHNGADLIYGIGTPVYTIGPGTVVFKSGPAEKSGWGIGNYAIVIRHSAKSGDFFAVYGHIQTSLSVGDTVEWQQQIATIGPYRETDKNTGLVKDKTPHLHFGIFPTTFGFPSNGWGRITDNGCVSPNATNGFVAPITFIRTKEPLSNQTAGTGRETGKVNLMGDWIGRGYGVGSTMNRVRIRQVGDKVEALKLTGTKFVPEGQVSWYGTYTSDRFLGKMQIAGKNHESPRWVDIVIKVIKDDRLLVVLTGRDPITGRNASGSVRFDRITISPR